VKKWLVTGVSGSERINVLNEVKAEAEKRGISMMIHDLGEIIKRQAERHQMQVVDERFLDIDKRELRLLCTSALQTVEMDMLRHPEIEHHFIAVHATFRWKGRLIQGISYADVLALKPDALINVVNDVQSIFEINRRNPKWDDSTVPTTQETLDWMLEEEFVTGILAEVMNVPVFIIARRHTTHNLADLFFTNKKRIYLSYPITAVEDEQPEMLEQIQGPILAELEKLFVVFNPLTIEDLSLAEKGAMISGDDLPQNISQINDRAIDQIKKRTVERDYQFIDQSDAVVVFYMTEKLSPGVISEVLYAHRNQKPVFMVFSGKRSPFLEVPTTEIHNTLEALMESVTRFAQK